MTKIFLSWSDNKSQRAAKAFKELLLSSFEGLTDTDIFMSADADSIKQGRNFYDQIINALKTAECGIIFIDDSNYNKPWLNFESGALKIRLNNSTFVVFNGYDEKQFIENSPLSFIQSLIDVKSRNKVVEMLETIGETIDGIEFRSDYFGEGNHWLKFLGRISDDYYYNNFKKALHFWISHVKKIIDTNGSEGSIGVGVINNFNKETGKLDHKNKVKIDVPDFDNKYLSLSENYEISFSFAGAGSSPQDSTKNFIAWVPNDPQKQTWFNFILYDANNKQLIVKYMAPRKNWGAPDSDAFKKHMKQYTGRYDKYKIDSLDLDSSAAPNEQLKSLYRRYLSMIEYSIEKDITD